MANRELELGSQRLRAIVDWLEPGSCLVDIGTDHAALPIALAEKGMFKRLVALDKNPGPLAKAEANILAAGLTDQVSLLLSDGLDQLDLQGDEVLVLAGMGGYLISQILERGLDKIKLGQRLILQPNWTWLTLRHFLADHGFSILKERVVLDRGKLYSIIYSQYTAEPYQITDSEAFIGLNIENQTETIYRRYLQRLRKIALNKGKGLETYRAIARDIEVLLAADKANLT